MSITSGSGIIIIEFFQDRVSGKPAVDGALIGFSTRYRLPKWNPRRGEQLRRKGTPDVFYPWFRIHYAKVFVQNDDKLLGYAYPELSRTFETTDHDRENYLQFQILLNSIKIDYVERERVGGDISFKLEIIGEYDDGLNYTSACESLVFNCNQKEWTDVLRSINSTEYVLYEADIPSDLKNDFKPILEIFDQAKKQLYLGMYDVVVAKCRDAIDAFIQLSEIKPDLDKARAMYVENRRSMTKDQRFMAYLDSIRHFTHDAHHIKNGEKTPYSRSDAICMLGATAGAISALANGLSSANDS
jgi:hypothetical protein